MSLFTFISFSGVFTKLSDLHVHSPCHTGEKPYECLHCGKAFAQRSNLRKHIQTHGLHPEQAKSVLKRSIEKVAVNSSTKKNPKQNKVISSPAVTTAQSEIVDVLDNKPSESENPAPVVIVVSPSTSVMHQSPSTYLSNTNLSVDMLSHQLSTALPPNVTLVPPINNDHKNQLRMQAPAQPVHSSGLIIPIDNNRSVILPKDELMGFKMSSNSESFPQADKPCPAVIESNDKDHVEKITSCESSKPKAATQTDNIFVCTMTGCSFIADKDSKIRAHHARKHLQPAMTSSFKCTMQGCDRVLSDVDSFLKHIQLHDKIQQKLQKVSESEQIQTLDKETKQSIPPASKNVDVSVDVDSSTSVDGENKKPIGSKANRMFRCQSCLNRYASFAALEQHRASTSHNFPCVNCTKVFPCERYLRRHMLTHGADMFRCHFCNKSFKTANYLKVHIIIHTGEKPFICTVCDAKFNRRDKLKRHELVHDPIKKYKCPLIVNGCTREFNRPDKLKAHILTHSGLKPYTVSSDEFSIS